jgi:O-antigen/teichoic acid export membrane protein
MRSVLREHLSAGLPLLVGTVVAGGLSYLAVTLAARLLGAADYGLLGTFLGIVSFGGVALRPLHSAATHAASVVLVRGEPADIARLGAWLVAMCIFGAIAIGIIVVALAAPLGELLRIGDAQWTLLLLPLLLGSLAYWQAISGLLLGMHRFHQFAAATVLDAGVRAAFIAPLVIAYGVGGALAGYIAGIVAANALGTYAYGGLAWGVPGKSVRQQFARVSGDWVVLTLLVAALQNLDLVLLRAYAPAEQVGWYAASAALANLLFTVSGPLYLPLYPRLVLARSQGRPTIGLLLGTLLPVVVAGAVAAWIASSQGPSISRLIYGDSFTPGGGLLPVLLLKTTALLALSVVGQHAIAHRSTAAILACGIPTVCAIASLAIARPTPEWVALTAGGGAASAALLAGLVLGVRASPGRRADPQRGIGDTV